MLEFHTGRLFGHVHIRVKDFDAGKRFYRAVMEVPGMAFQAKDRETVHRFHAAALAATTSRPPTMA